MAGFNRFGGGGLGSLYSGINNLQQNNRRDERFDERRNTRNAAGSMPGFERRGAERDFSRLNRDTSPRRRRYSPDPPYSGMRGNRRDERGDLSTYPLDHLGAAGQEGFSTNRGQGSSGRDRAGHNMGPLSRGDGILGAKPGDMPRDLASNANSGLTSQLAQQQQQLMAMVQTQSLLAAIQAQASAASKRGGATRPGFQPPSLMQGMRIQDNHGRMDNRLDRKRRMSPNRGGPIRNRNNLGGFNRMRPQNYQHQPQRNWQGNRTNYQQQQQQRRNYRRDRPRTSESSKKSEDNEPIEEPYVEENMDDEEEDEPESTEKATSPEEKTEDKTLKTEKDSNEKNAKPEVAATENLSDDSNSATNLAGQNVNQLVKSLFEGHRNKFVCKVCKIMCTKETCFRQHLYGRRHVKTWLESQGRSFEVEIFRRASEEAAKSITPKDPPKEVKEEEPKVKDAKDDKETEKTIENKDDVEAVESDAKDETKEGKQEESGTSEPKDSTPSIEPKMAPPAPPQAKEEKKEVKLDVKYSCDNRKTAFKDGEYINIASITEARVRVKGFDSGVNTQGFEFVKAVSGFNCRLCKTFILSGNDVKRHVEGRKHQRKYLRYVREHPKYEVNQLARNKELSDMLAERDGEEVLLYEVNETEELKYPGRSSEEVLNVQVTKYMAVPDENEDDNMDAENQDETNANEDVKEAAVKKDDSQDEVTEGEAKTPAIPEDHVDLLLEDTDELLAISGPEVKTGNEELEETPDLNASVDLLNDSTEEEGYPISKKPKLTTPTTRRGRKGIRGGAVGRGRGRGRGGKRNTRQSPKAAVNEEALPDDNLPEQTNEVMNFMDGFEVIDEVEDDE